VAGGGVGNFLGLVGGGEKQKRHEANITSPSYGETKTISREFLRIIIVAKQYWRFERLNSIDGSLDKRFPA
jgi:hypothetical protein